ncbi:MAG: TolC family protein [Verrucomicrobiota bacterium]
MKYLQHVVLITGFFVCGCSVSTSIKQPKVTYSEVWASEAESTDRVVQEWWKQFNDPVLERLISQASMANYDLLIAQSRVREARAARGIVAADALPVIGASGSARRISTSEYTLDGNDGVTDTVFAAGFDASWEIDLFGGNRSERRAADALIDAAVNDRRDVMVSVLAEVARNYIELRGSQKRLLIIQRNVDLQRKTLDLVKSRVDSGFSRELDQTRAEAQLRETQSQVPLVRAEIRAAAFRLSILAGRSPESLFEKLMTTEPLPVEPDIVPVGLRSDLLQRRPDVRSAEANLEAALSEVDAAKKELYPKFFLTGSAGFESLTFGDLLSSAAQTWTLGSLVEWPIFRSGEIRASIRVEEARAKKAVLEFERIVLEALGEVESSLTFYGEELQARDRLKESVDAARRSVALADNLYGRGLSSFLDVLEADGRLSETEDALVQSETRTLTSLVALYKSLGGGWESFE